MRPDLASPKKDEPREDDVEYDDGEQLATVTVVEAFDPNDTNYPPSNPPESVFPAKEPVPQTQPRKRCTQEGKSTIAGEKRKRAKNFRYETRAARLVNKAQGRVKRPDRDTSSKSKTNTKRRTRRG